MPQQQLKEQLEQLHRTLAEHPQLDSDTQALLQKIAADIDGIEGAEQPELTELVQEQAVRFEQEHPTLAEVLRQIVETLGRIGV